ncbi:MAG: DUF4160 domain-containing protein [Flavisolibacter sp.]
MPTLLLTKGFRFFFYSNEGSEAAHVHVQKGDAEGKIWLEPEVKTAFLHGFSSAEIHDIIRLIGEHGELFKMKWYEYFRK